MFARQFDTVKHSECYRPIPVHTPSSRRLPVAKQYMNSNADTATSPRYDQEYDYKTTHYPSYPPNYPYDENNKYKYEQQTPSSHHHHHPAHQPPQHQQQQSSGPPSQPYGGNYDKPPSYQAYEDENYDSRGYMASHAPPSATSGTTYPTDTEYSRYSSYEGGRSAYSGHDTNDFVNEKGRYSYGYERSYYDDGGRYMSDNNRHDTRYQSDSRHDSGRNVNDGGRDVDDLRYNVDGRDGDRRYVDGRDDDIRYESRDGDTRYMDGRTSDGRYDSGRYQSKENYYDRYYKHRPSRDHHASETSRY